MVRIFIFIFILLTLIIKADNDTIGTFFYLDCTPIFNSKKGNKELKLFIKQNLKYPKTAIKDRLEGVVYTKFIVEVNGQTFNHKVIKGIRSDLDSEALRVVRLIKYEKPAMQRGKPIKIKDYLPIIFKLDDTTKKKKIR